MKKPALVSLLAAGVLAAPAIAQEETVSGAPLAKWGPRIWLEEQGITPWLTVTGEAWNIPTGGNQHGNLWNVFFDFGFEVDLGAFGGPATARIVVQGHARESRDSRGELADTGSANPASGNFAGDGWRMFNVFYQQSFKDGIYDLKIGQIAADDDFMGSEYSGLFMNSSFGAMPSIVGPSPAFKGGAYAAYPVASPGIWFNWTPNESYSWQTGIYLGGPGDDEHGNHGFDWKSLSSSGILVFTEGAVNFDIAGKPSTFRLGGSLHTKNFEDFKSLNNGGEGTESTVYNVYVVHDRALAMADAETVKLGAFWRAGVTPQQDVATVFIYADAGINWFAPFASRPDDVAGAALSWTKLGRDYAAAEDAQNKNEFTIELTYRAQITSYWSVQGDIQYVINPAFADDRDRDALVLGLRTELSF
ncbi:carbohydrate-selective porin [Opitutaceae bacterium TAV1]|nr:carbohydrate-selective porin [Opitutaceae bacterium TAV1]